MKQQITNVENMKQTIEKIKLYQNELEREIKK